MPDRATPLGMEPYRAAFAEDEANARLILDPAGRVVERSRAAAELFPTADHPPSTSLLALLHGLPPDLSTTTTQVPVTVRIPAPGPHRELPASLQPLRSGGHLIGYLLRVTTPHELRQRRNQQRCRALLQMLTTNVWVSTADGEFADLLDLDADAATPSRPLTDSLARLHPDDLPGVMAAVERALQTRESFAVEARALTPDNDTRMLAMRGTALRDAAGRTVEWIGASVDVTAERRAASELAEAERRLKLALRASQMGVWEWTPHDGRVLLSPEGMAIFARRGITGTPAEIKQRIDPADIPENATKVRAALADGGHYRGEFRVRGADGQAVWIATLASVVREPNRPVRMLGTFHDITELKRADELMRRAQKMDAVGRLAGGVAHDFNNLLSVISMSCCALRTDLAAHDPAQARITVIEDALQRGAGLTRQLLALSRRQITQPVQLDANEHLARLANLLSHMLGEDVVLTTELSRKHLAVVIDPSQFEQVVLNVAVNARDAMPHGGRFTIRTSDLELQRDRAGVDLPPGQYVQVELIDSGVGMSDETKARLFEPFFSTKPAGQGSGLGLSVVHGIVTQAGGGIAVDSAVGQGTKVRILLPAVTAPPPQPTTAPAVPVAGRSHELVLLVEDQDELRRMLGMMLRALGYRVHEANGGAQALSLIEQGMQPDVLLSDVVMPHINGRQLAEAVRRRLPDVAVVYMSGYADDQLIQRGVLGGREVYLQKPFTAAELQATLRRALDGARPIG